MRLSLIVTVAFAFLLLSGCAGSQAPVPKNVSGKSIASQSATELDIDLLAYITTSPGLTRLQRDQSMENFRGKAGVAYAFVGDVSSEGDIVGKLGNQIPLSNCRFIGVASSVAVTISGVPIEEAIKLKPCDVLKVEGTIDFDPLDFVYLRNARILEVDPQPTPIPPTAIPASYCVEKRPMLGSTRRFEEGARTINEVIDVTESTTLDLSIHSNQVVLLRVFLAEGSRASFDMLKSGTGGGLMLTNPSETQETVTSDHLKLTAPCSGVYHVYVRRANNSIPTVSVEIR